MTTATSTANTAVPLITDDGCVLPPAFCNCICIDFVLFIVYS